MKLIIFFVLAALAFADDEVQVLREDVQHPVGASYSFDVELDNGVSFKETGSEGSEGQAVAQGEFAFVAPEGIPVQVSYTADENGFVPQSDALPQAPPPPEHVIELIRQAEELRARGVEWDERGFEI